MQRHLPPPFLLKFWSKNNRSLHNNTFCLLKKIPARKPKIGSIYHSCLITLAYPGYLSNGYTAYIEKCLCAPKSIYTNQKFEKG